MKTLSFLYLSIQAALVLTCFYKQAWKALPWFVTWQFALLVQIVNYSLGSPKSTSWWLHSWLPVEYVTLALAGCAAYEVVSLQHSIHFSILGVFMQVREFFWVVLSISLLTSWLLQTKRKPAALSRHGWLLFATFTLHASSAPYQASFLSDWLDVQAMYRVWQTLLNLLWMQLLFGLSYSRVSSPSPGGQSADH